MNIENIPNQLAAFWLSPQIAPRDGTKILCLMGRPTHGEFVETAYFDENQWKFGLCAIEHSWLRAWMPLPDMAVPKAFPKG